MIYAMRHGQTDRNLKKRFSGSTDVELNENGIEQARRQAEKLRGVKFDIVFSSPQKRARQTVEAVYSGTIIFDKRLCEITCGDFEDTPQTKEAVKLFKEASYAGTNGVEQFDVFKKRMNGFCDMLARDYGGRNILVCTHTVNVSYIDYYFRGKSEDYDFSKSLAANGEVILVNN